MTKKTAEEKLRSQLKKAQSELRLALPHDPDGGNDRRAKQARRTIGAYRDLTGAKRKNAVSELICDLMHLCDRDRHFRKFERAMDLAHELYEEQTAEPFS